MKDKKIAIITLMKNHSDLTIKLLESICLKDDYEKDLITVYIGDTGSNDDEKKKIIDYMSSDIPISLNIDYIEYDYYNFAKINNDIVVNHIDEDTDLILLINNDVELINNAISKSVETFYSEDNVGTVGSMLLYPDNTVQHGGIICIYDRIGTPQLTHCFLHKPYNKEEMNGSFYTLGNTGAFMLTSIDNWKLAGGLNNAYRNCFEDVEFNVNLLKKGKKNITNYDALCYHLESVTRKGAMCFGDIQMIRRVCKNKSVVMINDNLYNKIH